MTSMQREGVREITDEAENKGDLCDSEVGRESQEPQTELPESWSIRIPLHTGQTLGQYLAGVLGDIGREEAEKGRVK